MLKACCLEIEEGLSLLRKDRIRLMVSSVLKSHFEDVFERPKVWDAAVCTSNGTFGRRALKLKSEQEQIRWSSVPEWEGILTGRMARRSPWWEVGSRWQLRE